MRKLVLAVCILFAAALILAQASPLMAGEKAHQKTHEMKGEVVSIDTEGMQITFKDDKGEEHTAPVMGKALETFKTLEPGQKVVLTCTDNEKGEHQGVSKIKLVKEGGMK
jgi:ribosomal protein S1